MAGPSRLTQHLETLVDVTRYPSHQAASLEALASALKKDVLANDDVRRPEEEDGSANDGPLDLLFLLHSDLSSLLRQVDELVVQASKQETTSKHGTREIESFISILSDMLSSLKPWVPRLHKAISNAPLHAENQEGQSLMNKISMCPCEEEPFEVESPEHAKFESLISPSPLVSWRGDLNINKGKQLFLLTPLAIGKSESSKHQDLFKPTFESITSNAAGTHPLDISKETSDGLVGGKVMKRVALNNTSGPVVALATSKVEGALVSLPFFKKKPQSELLMTPCLKMSPPKSCALLEPPSGSCHREKQGPCESSRFPIVTSAFCRSQRFGSSGGGNSGYLALKYPELLGLQHASGITKTDLEYSSPDWSFSPPKTCVLLEPPDEKAMDKASDACKMPATCAFPDNKKECLLEPKNIEEHEMVSSERESAPMPKKAESVMEKGRRTGESTLKRELWTRFEEASTHGLRYSFAALQGTSKKGFLEMLEEVSGDEEMSLR